MREKGEGVRGHRGEEVRVHGGRGAGSWVEGVWGHRGVGSWGEGVQDHRGEGCRVTGVKRWGTSAP